ncbi:PhoPQ-activated pathogenicity-related family protein [Membranihabitans maritimus]|uniref:PhoPQ-activated pathogenicity-related family protein n=1 Tax=Membranihabitans maritimus TaxID=2904244 RepID=UPI001F2E925A|nr:PhoPQ-activated protein PqaA family protein [Membranihabitans maritimus]
MQNRLVIIFFLFGAVFIFSAQSCTESSGNPGDRGKMYGEINPENALQRYLQNDDETFEWELEQTLEKGNARIYQVKLSSQTWRGIIWTHSVSIVVPEEVQEDGALIFISGGKNNEATIHPDGDDEVLTALLDIASKNHAVTSLIRQVPNQPLFDDLTEDALISFTLHNYKRDNDFNWPLLFPMVKSVVKGMDVVQEFCKLEVDQAINSFLLTGFSKRGWTTWLTGAKDDRVKAIAPGVIDILNMPVNVDYQVKTWGDYSVEIQDYVRLGIAQDINSPGGRALATMIDPYSYRDDLSQPKLIFIGTNDPYWPVDAVKNYLTQLPGKTYIHYTPNAGHDLNGGAEAIPVLSEFFNDMLEGQKSPTFAYEYVPLKDGFSWSVSSEDPIEFIEQWIAYSPDRDFRNELWEVNRTAVGHDNSFEASVKSPESGYLATYWNVGFKGDIISDYPLSSRMYVMGEDSLYFNLNE